MPLWARRQALPRSPEFLFPPVTLNPEVHSLPLVKNMFSPVGFKGNLSLLDFFILLKQ